MELYFESSRIKSKLETVKNTLRYIKNTNIPLPSLVEISDSGTCNRVCSFCPRSDPNYKDIKEFISEDLHQSICRQLSDYEYCGMLKYSGFSEPFLHSKLQLIIEKISKTLPKVRSEIITNGDFLKKIRDFGIARIIYTDIDRDGTMKGPNTQSVLKLFENM